MICAARERPAPDVTGPHAATDQYGHLDHYYYRCERCGHERTDPRLRHGCPECETDADRP
jgi:rubrerythrin